MKEWAKAIKFVICFSSLCFIGGAMLAFGAHQSAEVVGVIVVIDESGWSAKGEGGEQ